MLVLDGFRIMEVHLKQISQPAEAFLDEGWRHACLVKEHTSPDMERIGGVYILRSSAEVNGHTFFTALRRSVAILLPVMYSSGAFLVL